MWSNHLQNHSKCFNSKCFIDTSLHIIKCLKCKMFHNFLGMFHLPAIFRKIQGFNMWSSVFQNHSKYFVDTSLPIIKCLKCKMFHNFLGMFHLPAIFRKIQGLKMWFDLFQNHSKCFVDTSLEWFCRWLDHILNSWFSVTWRVNRTGS
jgi:hypothetical protein